MAAFTWHVPAASDRVIGSNSADDILAAINAIFTSHSGDPGAKWEVAGYSGSSPRYCILRRKSGAAGRIVFFGQQGSTANAASTYQAAVANAIYVAYSKTSTANTPDNNWTSGAVLSASDFMPGLRANGLTSATWRFSYAEFDDGVYILASNTSSGISVFGAGELISDITGAAVSTVQTSGTNGSTSWPTTAAVSGSLFPATVGADASYSGSSGNAGLLVRTGGSNRQAFRAMLLGTSVAAKLNDAANSIAFFLPIPLVHSSTNGSLNVLGKLRQVGFGPNCDRETVRNDGAVYAYGHADTSASATNPGVWFVDAEL